MAYTVTTVKKCVFGNERAHLLQVTADAASGVIDTGLSFVDVVSYAPVSCATAGFKLKANLDAASAALNGSVLCSSAANGDVFFVVAYGRG